MPNNEQIKVVFTNGCFDLLHYGHVYFLEEAKKFGDLLFVGLNSDKSVRKIKGKARPIINEEHRFKMLAALQCVDKVILFDEETPYKLIQEIRPDILVKGNNLAINEIVGADFILNNGGEVRQIEILEGISTTQLIYNIQRLDEFSKPLIFW